MGAGEESWTAGQSLGFQKWNSVYYNDSAFGHEKSYGTLSSATIGAKSEPLIRNTAFTETKESLENEPGARLVKETKVESPSGKTKIERKVVEKI